MIWTMRWFRRSFVYIVIGVCLSLIVASLVLFQTTGNITRTKHTDHITAESQNSVDVQNRDYLNKGENSRNISTTLQNRRHLLEVSCQTRLKDGFDRQSLLNRLNPALFKLIYVDDRHQTLYCKVPKVACTNWMRVFLVLTGKMNTSVPAELRSSDVHGDLQQNYLRSLASYSPIEIEKRLKTYFKFLVVRDPLDRLISAYTNKFTKSYNAYFHLRFGRHIIKKYRANATEESLRTGSDVTFEEFVRYLLDPKTKQPLNSHWRPATHLCLPCLIEYDAVGKYETLSDDVQYVLEKMGVDGEVQFPPAPRLQRSSTFEGIRRQFSNISPADIHRLWELYADDYKLFGYPYPTSLFNVSTYENLVLKDHDNS